MSTRNNKRPGLHVRVTPQLRRRIDEMAKQLGLAPNELVRQAIVWYLIQIQKESGKVGKSSRQYDLFDLDNKGEDADDANEKNPNE